MVSAGCNCGAVQFQIDAQVSDIYVCHCSICRRFTGSAGIAVVLVENEKFKWTAGQENVAMWRKPGADWESWFCRICGSAVPGKNNAKTVFIPAGLIGVGGEKLRVAHHVFVGSKAPWDEIGDDGKQHVAGFVG